MSPLALDRVVTKCLSKDPDDRWQTARDVTTELTWVAEGGSQATVAAPVAGVSRSRLRVAWGVAAVMTVVAFALAVFYANRGPTESVTARLSVLTEAGSVTGLALSPDGSQLAFVTATGPDTQLWVRPLESIDARPLAGTEGALFPFWSPDGRAIGFFTLSELKTVDLAGGSTQTVCALQAIGRGGTWNDDDVIVFGGRTGGLLRVSANGGEPTPVTTLEGTAGEVAHRWPQFLPDADHFLFMGGTELQLLDLITFWRIYNQHLAHVIRRIPAAKLGRECRIEPGEPVTLGSAANNHQRFVRAQDGEVLIFPRYEQDAWVRTQDYQSRSWLDLITFWRIYNQHLAHVIRRIPAAKLGRECRIEPGEPVTLGYLVEDYLVHLRHHLTQIDQRRVVA